MSNLNKAIQVLRRNAPSPSSTPATVIFLHGLGDTGAGWNFLADEAQKLPGTRHINFVLPTSPTRLITAFREQSTGWFDVLEFGGRAEDAEGTLQTVSAITDLIKAEIEKGVPAERIVVGGFSQGSAISEALSVALPVRIGGFIFLSGWLPVIHELKKLEVSQGGKNKTTPAIALHGTEDRIVPCSWGERSVETLRKEFGFSDLTWKTYPGVEHSIDMNGLQFVLQFLEKVLPNR